MSIPANITTELASLQAQVQAAKPLSQASRATITALKLNAGNLVNDVQSALVAPSPLDSWVPPIDVALIVSGVLLVATAATDQNNLCVMRGVVGRASSNLSQIPS